MPLPGEPQGKAIAFDGAGGLLSGSERRHGTPGELRLVPGATALLVSRPPSPADASVGEPAAGVQAGRQFPVAVEWMYGVAGGLAVLGVAGLILARRRRRA